LANGTLFNVKLKEMQIIYKCRWCYFAHFKIL